MRQGMGAGVIIARPPALPLPPVAASLAVAATILWGRMMLSGGSVGMLSLAGMIALAFALRHLLLRLDAPQPDRAAALVLLMPALLFEAGGSAAIWAAPCVMALASLIDRRHAAMLGWFGLAIGLNMAALLIAPFFLALTIHRRMPFRLWPIVPVVAAAVAASAHALGWPMTDLAAFLTAPAGPALSLGAPNLWTIVQAVPLGVPLFGLALASSIGVTAAYTAQFSAQPLGKRGLLAAALLATLATAGLLPRMDETCFLLADILALALALTRRDAESWPIAILVQTGSMLALLGGVSGVPGLAMVGAVAMIAATVRVARPLLKPAANDNPLLARAI